MATLNAGETELLVAAGWAHRKTKDGPEFRLEVGTRALVAYPSIARVLSPVVFRPQMRLHDARYDEISARICGTKTGMLAAIPPNNAPVARWETPTFDPEFAARFTEAAKDWARDVDLDVEIEARLSGRMLDFWTEGPISDLVYLGKAEQLRDIAEQLRDSQDLVRTKRDPAQVMADALEMAV